MRIYVCACVRVLCTQHLLDFELFSFIWVFFLLLEILAKELSIEDKCWICDWNSKHFRSTSKWQNLLLCSAAFLVSMHARCCCCRLHIQMPAYICMDFCKCCHVSNQYLKKFSHVTLFIFIALRRANFWGTARMMAILIRRD